MKPLLNMLIKLRSIIPYFIIISIYFLLINFEARRENQEKITIEKIKNDSYTKSNNINVRVEIPVIPYER